MPAWRPVVFALAAAVLVTAPTAGQTVAFRGRGDLRTDTLIRRILATPGLRIFVRDSIVAAADTLSGPLLVAGATVKLENVVRGDLAIIDGNVFLRPGARVTGRVTNVAGGLFRAPSSAVDGTIVEFRDAPYRADVTGDAAVIRGMRAPAVFDADGFRGLLPPTYDRVNGLGLHGGFRLLLPRIGLVEPDLHARVDFLAARQRGAGGLQLGLHTPGGFFAGLGAERGPATRDAWIRTDFANSFWFAVLGEDLRNWYDAERAWAGIGHELPYAAGTASLSLTAQAENATSLPARDPWHAWGDNPLRANPAIDEGRIVSFALAAAADWSQPTFEALIRGSVERAVPSAGGDFAFSAFDLAGIWSMKALADHTYTLTTQFRGPLPGTAALPRQRWSAVGGRGTLPTLEDLERAGDRLVFLSSEYSIPIPGIDLRLLGEPALELVHVLGTAWSDGKPGTPGTGSRDIAQNLGLRLRFRLTWIMGIVDPSDSDSFRLLAGFARPLRYPWTPSERR
jgi:hypothetical protein